MKTKYYKFEDYTFKAYYKPVGHGYEVGVTCGTKPCFVGNFVHKSEADRWWNLMSRYNTTFFKKYHFENMPKTWFMNFYANHTYALYYTFLDKVFAKYNKSYHKAYHGNVKQFNVYKKKYNYTKAA